MTQDEGFKKPSIPVRNRTPGPISPIKNISQSPTATMRSFSSPVRSQNHYGGALAGKESNEPTTPTSSPRPGRGRTTQARSASASRSRSRSRSSRFTSPDRFIPSSTSVQSFRMGLSLDRLSEEERYLRKRSASPDPFRKRREDSPGARYNELGGRNIRRRGRQSYPGVYVEGSRGMNVIEASMFSDEDTEDEENQKHEERLALALGVDRATKVFKFSGNPLGSPQNLQWVKGRGKAITEGAGAGDAKIWGHGEGNSRSPKSPEPTKPAIRQVPTAAFRYVFPAHFFRMLDFFFHKADLNFTILDAPGLRDDFYCSLIAYSPTNNVLAVALDTEVYTWGEGKGVTPLRQRSTSHVTSLAFSSPEGGNEILAVGRMNGTLYLQTKDEELPRKQAAHQFGIACVSWRPVVVERRGLPGSGGRPRMVEELFVGDEMGSVFYYCVEWDGPEHGIVPTPVDTTLMLIRRFSIHSQQVCGIAWSPDGQLAATGGNDNTCILLDMEPGKAQHASNDIQYIDDEIAIRYCWVHKAAVKAIAFCPWQRGLLATGGGSNDRFIRFHHAFSGTTLTQIHVSAQVTSLIWAKNHREIAGCFGYSSPEHPIRIAVFSWPDCTQILSIPWGEDMRALYAIAYPGGPRKLPSGDLPTHGDGCIVVVSSDERIRFHEVWSGRKKPLHGLRGVLGGSDILEGLEGIEKETDLIR